MLSKSRNHTEGTRVEPSLLIVFSPPADSEEKALFEHYQICKATGAQLEELHWESIQRDAMEFLFGHQGDEPSHVDELLESFFKTRVRIKRYFFAMGRHQGFWVPTVTITKSMVELGEDCPLTWPPPKEINDLLINALGYVLKREWVGAFTFGTDSAVEEHP